MGVHSRTLGGEQHVQSSCFQSNYMLTMWFDSELEMLKLFDSNVENPIAEAISANN